MLTLYGLVSNYNDGERRISSRALEQSLCANGETLNLDRSGTKHANICGASMVHIRNCCRQSRAKASFRATPICFIYQQQRMQASVFVQVVQGYCAQVGPPRSICSSLRGIITSPTCPPVHRLRQTGTPCVRKKSNGPEQHVAMQERLFWNSRKVTSSTRRLNEGMSHSDQNLLQHQHHICKACVDPGQIKHVQIKSYD